MAALVVFALVLVPVMGFNKLRKYRARKRAQKELRVESDRIASEHERLFVGETAYEPPPYEEIVSAYDVNRNVDDAVKRPLGREDEWGTYQSQRSQDRTARG